MASSSYWKQQYLSAKKNKEYYAKRKSEAEAIKKALRNNYESKDATNRMRNCMNYLLDGLDGENVFSVNAVDAYNSQAQAEYDSDPCISSAIRDVEAEIRRLESKRSEAESDEKYYYNRYKAAKRAERAAAEAAKKAAAAQG